MLHSCKPYKACYTSNEIPKKIFIIVQRISILEYVYRYAIIGQRKISTLIVIMVNHFNELISKTNQLRVIL